MNEVLKKIRDFTDQAHGEQMRKYEPARYIVHPERVMETCSQYTGDMAVLAAALLHDVLEDTPVTETELRDFLLTVMDTGETERTIKLVQEMTDVYTLGKFPQYNRRKRKALEADRIEKTSAEAQTIKYADIMDNTSGMAAADPDFAGTFLFEYRALLKRIRKGNEALYKRAVKTVEDEIQRIPSGEV